MESRKYQDQDEYIASFPAAIQQLLHTLRDAIQTTAPEATACISYNMPAYKYQGVLVYFAAYKQHIGFYPTGSGVAQFLPKLAAYKTSKGAIQFPLDQDLPLDLVREIVQFRVEENRRKAKLKGQASAKKSS